jgi:effector-binding domain-containing protein
VRRVAWGMTEPQIEERPDQPYLGIRCEITEGIPAAVDSAFPRLFAWLGEQGAEPSGPPFIRYLELDGSGEPLLIDVGAPVTAERPGGGPVEARVLPAGRYVTRLHVGPYRHATEPDLTAARDELRGWIEERGIATNGLVEHYRVGPPLESDWTKWETELAYLVEG